MPACLKNHASTFRTGETKATKPQQNEETHFPFLRAACRRNCFHVYTMETRQRLWLRKLPLLLQLVLFCHHETWAYIYTHIFHYPDIIFANMWQYPWVEKRKNPRE